MLLCNPGNTEVIQFPFRFVRNTVLSQFSFGNIIELSDKVRGLSETISKIGHLAKAIAHAKSIAFAKWSVWVKI